MVTTYQDWTITLTFQTDVSDKQLGTVLNKNNKIIPFFSRIILKPQYIYTTIDKELLSIVNFLNKSQGILFLY